MKTTRRNFFKVVTGGLGFLAVSAFIPVNAVLTRRYPKKKHPKDMICGKQNGIMQENPCKDFSPQVTIDDYNPGAPVKFQDLRVDPECVKCMYESNCTCGGHKFVKRTEGQVYEYWNEKLQREWYNNFKKAKV